MLNIKSKNLKYYILVIYFVTLIFSIIFLDYNYALAFINICSECPLSELCNDTTSTELNIQKCDNSNNYKPSNIEKALELIYDESNTSENIITDEVKLNNINNQLENNNKVIKNTNANEIDYSTLKITISEDTNSVLVTFKSNDVINNDILFSKIDKQLQQVNDNFSYEIILNLTNEITIKVMNNKLNFMEAIKKININIEK